MNDVRNLDQLWVMICTAQVLLMQAGFCLLESGAARTKHSISVAIKNLVDFCISIIVFWLVGFGVMYAIPTIVLFPGSGGGESWSSSLFSFFLYQAVFCGTATTLIGGAVAERVRFRGYLLINILVSGLIYPIVGQWVWGGLWDDDHTGWLQSIGFIDYAGATVVHSVGAWVALAALAVLGPRIGRFGKKRRRINASSLPSVVLGTLVLWFGWIGFNGGAGLAFDDKVPGIICNTLLAGAAGGVVALVWGSFRKVDHIVAIVANGVVSGLVSVTAACHLITPQAAIVIAAVGAILCTECVGWLERMKIDDVVGAVPAHGLPGVWGTLSVALFGSPALWQNGNGFWQQLSVQAIGCGVVMCWAFGVSLVILFLANRWLPLRATARNEYIGLNVAEHHANSDLRDLLTEMARHRRDRDFKRRVSIVPNTEVGQIAAEYNRVLDQVRDEMSSRLEVQGQFKDVVQRASEGIFQTDANGTLQHANPALASLLGFDSSQALLAHCQRHPGLFLQRNDNARLLNELDDSDRVQDFRTTIQSGDQGERTVSINARLVRDHYGDLQSYEGTVVDITERLRAETLTIEKEQAEAASHAKSEFLAGMSHEMRTPLNGVIAMLDMIDDNALEQRQKKYLGIAQSSATTLLAIINDVLDLSKVESGQLEIESVPLSIEAIINDTVSMQAHASLAKGLQIDAFIDQSIPDSLVGDPLRLRQITLNLVNNAVKFTDFGHIRVDVQYDSARHVLTLRVSDTGVGISVEQKHRIFQPFVQAEAGTSRNFGGTGLGLSICLKLIDAMGGQIDCHSLPGQGSTFVVNLPMRTSTQILPRAAEVRLALDSLQPRNVLLLSHDDLHATVVRRYLEQWGFAIQQPKADESIEQTVAALAGCVEVVLADATRLSANDRTAIQRLGTDVPIVTWGLSPHSPDLTDSAPGSLDPPIRRLELAKALNAGSIVGQVAAKDISLSRQTVSWDGRRVLVIDDNEVNTIVASELCKAMGFQVDVAYGGLQAIDLARHAVYDMILIDCQMPVLDGYETTKRLRLMHEADELRLSPHAALRIVAVTAEAVLGQRERCLSAGMDAMLPKPISRQSLTEMFRRVLPGAELPDAPSNTDTRPAIDMADLVSRCGDDVDVTRTAIALFKQNLPKQHQQLQAAVSAGNQTLAKAKSHSIKGMAANLSAKPLAHLAADLERQLKDRQSETVTRSMDELEAEINRCLAWIEDCVELHH